MESHDTVSILFMIVLYSEVVHTPRHRISRERLRGNLDETNGVSFLADCNYFTHACKNIFKQNRTSITHFAFEK